MEIGRIRQLSQEVIGQIAAGEVVERPAAAIKELVENSIDAGATAISVEIRDGGISYIRITDNGKGIQTEDIRLAFARHATSKIFKADDLNGIRTLGFRGEALASIAAVSKVKCVTRARGSERGISIVNEGGTISDIQDTACPEGTTFTIRDLFYNTPARKKFLKKPATEAAAVSDLMARMILSHPDISFRFSIDGKNVFFSAGDGKAESAVMCVFGLSTLKKLYKVEGHMNGVLLSGYVGCGELSRGNRSQQYFFLNSRMMKSNTLTNALEYACKQRVMIGRFPICILYLTVPFETVDVNVHPNKWQVRFQDEKAVSTAVETIIADAFNKTAILDKAPQLFDRPDSFGSPREAVTAAPAVRRESDAKITISDKIIPDSTKQPPVTRPDLTGTAKNDPLEKATGTDSKAGAMIMLAEVIKNVSVQDPVNSSAKNDQVRPAKLSENILTPVHENKPAQKPLPSVTETRPKEPVRSSDPSVQKNEIIPRQITFVPLNNAEEEIELQYIGVVFDTYILLKTTDKLLMCDQHACHERILYEKYMKECSRERSVQQLLVPIMLDATRTQLALYSENKQLLYEAGYDTEEFGDTTLCLRGVPNILGQPRDGRCLLDALDELEHTGMLSHADRISRIIQSACKHAIKGGDKISDDQLIYLIRQILNKKIPPTCPHGRPLFIEVSRRDLEKRFKRIQD